MIVLDTHILVWLMEGNRQLGKQAIAVVDIAAANTGVLIPAICIWEIALLVEKQRIVLSQDLDQWIGRALALPGVALAQLEMEISIDSIRLPDKFHADPADRIIVATARFHDATLLTVDRATLAYAKAGHVKVLDASL